MERQLLDWHATDEVLRAPPGPAGTSVYRIATDELGIWLTLHTSGSRETTVVFRISSDGSSRVVFDSDCQPIAVRVRGPSERPKGAFTDLELQTMVARHPRLVVYWWSPHLPLSVEGYFEIERAATELGIPLLALVDPAADETFVRETAEERAIPREACRVSASVELLFRDLPLHAPAVLLFVDGEATAPLPGYRNAGSYREHLLRSLASE